MTRVKLKLCFITTLIIIINGCSFLKKQDKNLSEEAKENKYAVSIWDNVLVREKPNKNGKFVSSLSLGEIVTYVEEEVKDNSVEYIKIKLSDGNEGWCLKSLLVLNSYPAIVIAPSLIYEHPNKHDSTNVVLDVMSMVAVLEESDGFVYAIGEKNKKNGWIDAESISKLLEDIGFAVMAKRELYDSAGLFLPDRVEGFFQNVPFKSEIFYKYILERRQNKKTN